MSAIVGINYSDERPVNRGELARMLAALRQRGPHGADVWIDGNTGLGSCLLDTGITVEARPQLTAAAGGDLIITADARLDYRDELAEKLELDRSAARDFTDGALILRAYQKWQESCLDHLTGDFAFALRDRQRRALFLARDHFGCKPLVYHASTTSLAFASEIKALLQLSWVSSAINELRIADFLVEILEGADDFSTFYQNIYRFPAGHFALISDGGRPCVGRLPVHSYWQPNTKAELRLRMDEDYLEAFRAVFTRSVAQRLAGAHIGAMLSGGVDSSAIACVARDLSRQGGRAQLATFSATTDNQTCVETQSINTVLRTGGFRSHCIRPADVQFFVAEFDRMLNESDDPFDSLIAHVPLAIYALAARQGIHALLDGLDGDLVATLEPTSIGYHLRAGRLLTAAKQAVGYARYYETSVARILRSGLKQAVAPTLARRARPLFNVAANRVFARAEATFVSASVIQQDFACAMKMGQRLPAFLLDYLAPAAPSIREGEIAIVTGPSITAAFERYDRIAALFAIEPRHPFLDKKLVEFCWALPWRQQYFAGWSKPILRRSMIGVMPEQICWRTGKEHLGVEFTNAWLTLKKSELLDVTSSADSGALKPYVNIAALRATVRRAFPSDPVSNLYEEDGLQARFVLLKMLALNRWLQRNRAQKFSRLETHQVRLMNTLAPNTIAIN